MSKEEMENRKLTEEQFVALQKMLKERMSRESSTEFESFDGYELPPRTQFSMLKKPAVSIKWGKMTFNMACIRLFEGKAYVLPIVNRKKKRLAVIPCREEESSTIEWARTRVADGSWVNKEITSIDFLHKLFVLMGWERECRYKILGRVADSERGKIIVFELGEAIMYPPKKEEYTDPVTGETKKKQVVFYPDFYKDRIGKSYNEYAQYRQMTLFEDFTDYIVEQRAERKSNENPD